MARVTWTYQFPEITKTERTLSEQLEHVRREVREAEEALTKGDRESTKEELMDVIHAAETALRMIPGGMSLHAMKAHVIAKNEERGYYDER